MIHNILDRGPVGPDLAHKRVSPPHPVIRRLCNAAVAGRRVRSTSIANGSWYVNLVRDWGSYGRRTRRTTGSGGRCEGDKSTMFRVSFRIDGQSRPRGLVLGPLNTTTPR